jgi:hypothetical protein
LSDTTTETEDQPDNVVLGNFARPRRAHRRVRPIEDEATIEVAAEAVPAELSAPPAIVAIANSRRGTHLTRLRADLLAVHRYSVPINGSGDARELARQAAVREMAIADAARKIEEVEALQRFDLIRAYNADAAGIWRG